MDDPAAKAPNSTRLVSFAPKITDVTSVADASVKLPISTQRSPIAADPVGLVIRYEA